jgi:hypothetical protein
MRSVDRKEHANKKRNFEMDCPFSNTGEDIYSKYFSVSWPSLEAALPILYPYLVKNNFLRSN